MKQKYTFTITSNTLIYGEMSNWVTEHWGPMWTFKIVGFTSDNKYVIIKWPVKSVS